jgi:hypothetical protein
MRTGDLKTDVKKKRRAEALRFTNTFLEFISLMERRSQTE